MKKVISIFISLILFVQLWAQVDTVNLNQIDVDVLRSIFEPEINMLSLDSEILSNYQDANLGELLGAETSVFIKSYGLGSLATSSVRGAGANHTKVLWNGFDVGNPMLGQVDFSYFSVQSFDKISINLGNNTGLYGGGTQGGVIHLQNNVYSEKGEALQFRLGVGSFNHLSQAVRYSNSQNKVSTRISIENRNEENNFPYEEFGEMVKRENAKVKAMGVAVSNTFKLNDYNHISVDHWYQHNERGIPTVIGVPQKGEQLENEFLRNAVRYNYYGNKHTFKIGTAYFEEQLNYTNPTASIQSNSRFKRVISEVESKYVLPIESEVLIGMNTTYDVAYSENYIGAPDRLSYAFFTSFKKEFFHKKLTMSQSVRKEFVANMAIPFTGTLACNYGISKKFNLTGSASKNYRIPTFNDLYYGSLGNPDLRPENGWGGEVSLSFIKKYLNSKLTGYYNDYQNWIVWLPNANGVWNPTNKEVITKGVELYNNLKWKSFFIRMNTSFVRSLDVETRKQLIYVPIYTSNMVFGHEFQFFNISYGIQYTDKRFITTDNSVELDPFILHNLRIGKEIKIENGMLNLGFKIENIMNKNYQALVNFPMPGRYFKMDITFKFINKSK